jgi:hypothetical protein
VTIRSTTTRPGGEVYENVVGNINGLSGALADGNGRCAQDSILTPFAWDGVAR